MREEEFETAIKVVVVGNGAVGKSSMIQRYCKGIFTKDYKKTIGVDFLERQIEVNTEDVRLMLWDTAGQEEFDAITKAYYRGAQACVLAFSTVDRESFEAVESWKKKVEDEVGEIGMVIVQNKIDLIDDAVVEPEEAENLAKRLRLRFYRTSVKDNLNVEEVFRYLSEKYLEQINEVEEEEEYLPKTIGTSLMDSEPINNSKDNHVKEKNGTKNNKHKYRNHHDDGAIKLEPSKRRTKGKKSVVKDKCVIL
ncbi:ras-related protein Rab-23-like [Mytilus galloprovincialis]|uniref:ras-related protein Rab-23-like n=1 Tax=Mytilus edulis TaxID=6550 RepID=UPI0039F12567